MAHEDSVLLLAGAYSDEAGAQADYDVVKDLHANGVIGGFDAAVITKDGGGKIRVNKDETAARKGAWGGLAVGALAGILFPPSLIASAAVGAAAGGFGGHLWKGMSRGDMKDIGEMLDEGEAALIVIGDWRLEERIDELLSRAERRLSRELRALDRAETEARIASLMSG
jgi:uncharacterized membrane protein